MSDIWSRAWCETQQIHNFALKGMTPSNEVRDSPNYIPRVNFNQTQYGSIYDNSRSSSPEVKEILCFQFRKKDNKKPRTPIVSRKSKTVLEKVPNFKASESHPPSLGPSACTPPASPGQVRVVRRPSITSSNASSGYQQTDISTPGVEKLPDVVAHSSSGRTNNDRRPVLGTIQDSPVPARNCADANIPPRNIKNIRTESDNISKIHELEIENQRLKEIFQDNSMTPLNKKKVIINNTDTSEKKNTAHKTGKVHIEQFKPKTSLSSTLNCMTSEKGPYHEANTHPSQSAPKKHSETGTRRKTEAKTIQKVKHNIEHRSVTDLQGSAPSTPEQGSRRMSKTCLKVNLNNIQSSSRTTDKYSSKKSPFESHTPGYVFIGSRGQVLAECKGYSSRVIVKSVRSSVGDGWEAAEDTEGSEEEFEVEKILAAQKLREISLRMEKSKIINSKSETSRDPSVRQGL